MNIEDQVLDLCNVKTKNNVVDNVTNNSDEIIPRISELMDGDLGKQVIGTEAADTSLGRLTDNPRGGEDNHRSIETFEIDEVNGNKNNSVPDSRAIVSSVLDISTDDQPSVPAFAFGEGDYGGDMDIGVDLSLDESGMLESEPVVQRLSLAEEPPFSSTNSDSSTPGVVTDKQPEKPSEQDSSPVSAGEESLTPAPDEEDDKHKHGKRVTFPSDEDIVSGAVEPKDPWRHAQNVTVDEIITAYRQACVKLNCKPIPKVLKQMQELKDLTQRNECLDLKGEKLDYKACESLEEVFKRVQFKVVDLEQTNLDEDGASALFDMIEYYESATHLNISFNKHIGTRGWQSAAHMMRKTSSLQYLDARHTPLLDHSAPFVARALRISGSLAVLHLENAGLSGRPLMLLATALKMNMNLRELYLADNKLNGLQDSAQLGNLLKFNYNIQILDLRNNHIMDSGLAYVCEGLKEQRKGLVTLVLWNNQLSHNGMGYLAAALPCTQSLETLNLGHNSVGNEGVHKLKDGLITNRSVLRLGLASTKLSCEGAVAVAEFIAESPRLLRLDLRENEIKTGGLMALSLALKVNTSLLRLDLDREPKKETVKSFIDTQRALLAEIQNGCKQNFILAKEKEETEQMMRQSASMAEIATEDEAAEEEEEEEGAASGKQVEKVRKDSDCDQEGGVKGTEGQTDSQSSASCVGGASSLPLESDSDTEDEEDRVDLPVAPSTSSAPKLTGPSVRAVTTQHPLSASHIPPSPSAPPSPGAVISGITVSTGAPGTPPLPGRCISVSSPGRGHKIFMVTRVESPPDQQQILGNTGTALSHAPQVPVVSLLRETPQPPSHPLQEEVRIAPTTPATRDEPRTTDRNGTGRSPAPPSQLLSQPHPESPSSPPETLAPLPNPPTVELVHSAPETKQSVLTEQSPVTAALSPNAPIGVGPTQPLAPPCQMEEVTAEAQCLQSPGEQQSTKDVAEREESGKGLETEECPGPPAESPTTTEEDGTQSEQLPQQQPSQKRASGVAPQPLMPPLATQISTTLPAAVLPSQPDSELLSPHQELSDPQTQQQVAPVSQSDQGVLESVAVGQDGERGREDQTAPMSACLEQRPEQELYLSEENQQNPAEQALPVILEQQPEKRPHNLVPGDRQQGGQSQTARPTEPSPVTDQTDIFLEEEGQNSPSETKESPDESSTDEGDSVEDEVEVVGSALPNGLKPEFALHLLEPQGPKSGSCVMEHGESHPLREVLSVPELED
uniref:Protein phosphatase 1 regulatory subunit 37 n=1 Tax=Esox lucius TaxID=8010 RepID=A0A6Q2YL49_ESOLU